MVVKLLGTLPHSQRVLVQIPTPSFSAWSSYQLRVRLAAGGTDVWHKRLETKSIVIPKTGFGGMICGSLALATSDPGPLSYVFQSFLRDS